MEGMNFIQTLRLSNILSYGSCDAEFSLQPLNVLTGPNASGKSNLIEALSLLAPRPGTSNRRFVRGEAFAIGSGRERPARQPVASEVPAWGALDARRDRREPMVSVKLFLEGGGDRGTLRTASREFIDKSGVDREAAARTLIRASRQNTPVKHSSVLLLVDDEEP